jgi:hypothetical protein
MRINLSKDDSTTKFQYDYVELFNFFTFFTFYPAFSPVVISAVPLRPVLRGPELFVGQYINKVRPILEKVWPISQKH